MAKNYKGVSGPGGVQVDPQGFWERISGTVPTAPSVSAGVWVRREGVGYVSFGGVGPIWFFTPNGTPNDIKVLIDYNTLTYWVTDPTNGNTNTGVSSVLNQWDFVVFDISGGSTTSAVRVDVNGTTIASLTVNFVWPTLFGYFLTCDSNAFSPSKLDGSIVAPIVYNQSQTRAFWDTQRTTQFAPLSTTNIFNYVRMANGGSATADTSGNGFDYSTFGPPGEQDASLPEPTFPSAATFVDFAQTETRKRVWALCNADTAFPSISAPTIFPIALHTEAPRVAPVRRQIPIIDTIPPILSHVVDVQPIVTDRRPVPRGRAEGDFWPPLFRQTHGMDHTLADRRLPPRPPIERGEVIPPLFRQTLGFDHAAAVGRPPGHINIERGEVIPPILSHVIEVAAAIALNRPIPRRGAEGSFLPPLVISTNGFEHEATARRPTPRGQAEGTLLPPLFLNTIEVATAITAWRPPPRGQAWGDFQPPLFRQTLGFEDIATRWRPVPRGVSDGTFLPPILSHVVEVQPVYTDRRPVPRGESVRQESPPTPLFRQTHGFELVATSWRPRARGDALATIGYPAVVGTPPIPTYFEHVQAVRHWRAPIGLAAGFDAEPTPIRLAGGGFEPAEAARRAGARPPIERGEIIPPLVIPPGGFDATEAARRLVLRRPLDATPAISPAELIPWGESAAAVARAAARAALVVPPPLPPIPVTGWAPDSALALARSARRAIPDPLAPLPAIAVPPPLVSGSGWEAVATLFRARVAVHLEQGEILAALIVVPPPPPRIPVQIITVGATFDGNAPIVARASGPVVDNPDGVIVVKATR